MASFIDGKPPTWEFQADLQSLTDSLSQLTLEDRKDQQPTKDGVDLIEEAESSTTEPEKLSLNLTNLAVDAILELLKRLDIPDVAKMRTLGRIWQQLADHNEVWNEIARSIGCPTQGIDGTCREKVQDFITNLFTHAHIGIRIRLPDEITSLRRKRVVTIESCNFMLRYSIASIILHVWERVDSQYVFDLRKKNKIPKSVEGDIVLAGNFKQWILDNPQKVSGLTDLSLSIYWDALTLPEEIGLFTQLRKLDLHANRFTTWPAQICKLTQLTTLSVSHNRLTRLPKKIGLLTQLRKLDLNSNQLATLPREIGKLKHLKELVLWGNQLTTLPSKIKKLRELRELYLNENKLTILPAEIGKLAKLKQLVLSENRLTTLPATMGLLKELVYLSLHTNPFTSLPTEMGQMTSLKELVIDEQHSLLLPPMHKRVRIDGGN